ncbi:hypothetical protein BCEN4_2390004 [Burkholderia cenocepacia]|nr:hypothetical protein BCEN4_2390004 [Burkholderia cenocepacia]
MTMNGFWGAASTIGRYIGMVSFRQGANVFPGLSYSDRGKSKSVLFWEIK